MKRSGNPAPVLSVSKSLRETHRPLQRRLSLLGPADATTTTASTMTRRVRRPPARYRDVSVDIPAAERHPRGGVSSDAPLPPGTYVELVSHPGKPSLLAVIEAVDPSIHPAAPAPADAAIYTLMHLVRLSTLMRAPDAEPHASALRRAGYPVDGQLETHGRWELVALRLPTSRAYARTAFARVRLLDVDLYEDVIDAEPVDESTRYVWRFELDQERGGSRQNPTRSYETFVSRTDGACSTASTACTAGGTSCATGATDRTIFDVPTWTRTWERTNPGSAATRAGAAPPRKSKPSARGKSSERRARHTKKPRRRATRTRRNAPRNRGVRARSTRGVARGTRVDSVFRGCRTEERTRALTRRGWLEDRRMDDARLRDVSSTTPTPRSRATAEPSRDTRRAISRWTAT